MEMPGVSEAQSLLWQKLFKGSKGQMALPLFFLVLIPDSSPKEDPLLPTISHTP
jgi:hypothetical protein